MNKNRGYFAALLLSIVGGAAAGNVGENACGLQWLCCLAGGGAGMLVIALLGRLRQGSLFEKMKEGLGETAGRAAALLTAAVSLRLCAHDLAAAGEFLAANLLESTPYLIAAGSLAAAVGYAAAKGERAVRRWSVLMLPPLVGMILLAILLALPDLRLEELARFPGADLRGEADAALDFFLLPFCGSLGCELLRGEGSGRQGVLAGLLAGLLLALLYAVNTALLGAQVLGNFNFPTYHALRVIGLSSLALRLESLLMLPLVMVSFLRMAVLLLAARRGVDAALGTSRWTPVLLAAAALLLSKALYVNQSSLVEIGRSLRFAALVLPGAALAGAIRAPRRRKNG